MNMNFLIPESIDEELHWLEGMLAPNETRIFETEHFFTYYYADEGYNARYFTDLMEEAYRLLIARGLSQLRKKILILICHSREQFKQFWGNASLPGWVKIFVHSGRILVVDRKKTNNLLQSMSHELMHIFLRQDSSYLPVWLEEGLCEYFSQSYNHNKFRQLVLIKKLYGFKEMEALVKHNLLDLDDSLINENICYRQAHSFVAFLAELAGEKKLMECIRTTSLIRDVRSAFEQHYGLSLDSVEEKWRERYSLINYKKLKPSENLKIIQNENRLLLYNSFYGQSLITNIDMLNLMDYIKEGKTIKEIDEQYEIQDLYNVMAGLYEKDLIVFDDYPKNSRVFRKSNDIKTGRLITSLRLNLTNACNMACSYCYVEHDETADELMNWMVAKKALDSFFLLQKRHGHRHSLIRFFGGEPMLNWSLIERTLEYVKTVKEEIEVSFFLNTNGTILNPLMTQVLSGYKVHVLVSLDGVGPVNDKFRKYHSGKGSFATIDKNLDLLLTHNCSVSIETTLNNHNYNYLKELIDYLAEKGSTHDCKIPLGLQNMTIIPKDGLDSLSPDEKAARVIEAIIYARQRGLDAMNGMVNFPFNTLIGKRKPGTYCGGTGKELCVYPNGDIYPCSSINMKLGTVVDMEGVFKTDAYFKLSQRVAGNIPACRGCDIEGFCAGGCAADAMAISGDIFEPTKNCELEKAVFRALVKEFLFEAEEKDTA